jgi:DNA-binding transcriptional MerR regulator
MDVELVEEYYAIHAVAAQCGVDPATLVRYERAGLVRPRVINDVRFYSPRDVERLATIRRLTDICGINLAGVDVVLRLLDESAALMGDTAAGGAAAARSGGSGGIPGEQEASRTGGQ